MNISSLNVIQIIIMLLLFVVIIFLVRQNIAIKHERRIARYSIEPINNRFSSMFDNFKKGYNNFVYKLRKPLSKSVFLVNASKKYEKYVIYGGNVKAIDYITNKLIIGLIFMLLSVLSKVLQAKMISVWELIINFAIGYFVLDVYLRVDKKRKEKIMRNQLLRAIIIMNNAFKSGKSTLQAIEIASRELSEPLNHEFEKMYKDMKYGLSVDTVFERFSNRVDIEEAKYLSSSLTILNKTGGNIVKVFSSIERTLFDRKKLDEELKNLTVSSNMIVKILTVVPVVFVLVIYMLNPNYFDPLFSSLFGYILITIIILMFMLYIWTLRKIMKVKV